MLRLCEPLLALVEEPSARSRRCHHTLAVPFDASYEEVTIVAMQTSNTLVNNHHPILCFALAFNVLCPSCCLFIPRLQSLPPRLFLFTRLLFLSTPTAASYDGQTPSYPHVFSEQPNPQSMLLSHILVL